MACRGPNAEDSWIDNAARQDPINIYHPQLRLRSRAPNDQHTLAAHPCLGQRRDTKRRGLLTLPSGSTNTLSSRTVTP
jgi:hypothetical protein